MLTLTPTLAIWSNGNTRKKGGILYGCGHEHKYLQYLWNGASYRP